MNSLENVKVGDTLLVQSRWRRELVTVERLTATLVIAGGQRFKKATGYQVNSDTWNSVYATIATDADVKAINREIKRRTMLTLCKNISFHDLSDTQLEQILEISNNRIKLD